MPSVSSHSTGTLYSAAQNNPATVHFACKNASSHLSIEIQTGWAWICVQRLHLSYLCDAHCWSYPYPNYHQSLSQTTNPRSTSFRSWNHFTYLTWTTSFSCSFVPSHSSFELVSSPSFCVLFPWTSGLSLRPSSAICLFHHISEGGSWVVVAERGPGGAIAGDCEGRLLRRAGQEIIVGHQTGGEGGYHTVTGTRIGLDFREIPGETSKEEEQQASTVVAIRDAV